MVKKKILIILLTTVCLFCIVPVIPVAAQDPVVLVMGGEGTTPWNVGNIVPGDSGTKNTTAIYLDYQYCRFRRVEPRIGNRRYR